MRIWLQSYLKYLEEGKISKNTIAFYKGDLNDWLRFLAEQQVTQAKQLTPYHLDFYLEILRKEGKSVATIARRMAALRAFCKYLVLQQQIRQDPSLHLITPKAKKKTRTLIAREQLSRLIELPNIHRPEGLRDRAILELMYATGLRVTELTALDVNHIKMDRQYLVCAARGLRERVLPIGDIALFWLREYVEKARPNLQHITKIEPALFLNHLGSRLTRQGLWKIIRKYAAFLGLDVTPRMLRKLFASHLLENGADSRVVQDLLGQTLPVAVHKFLTTPKPRLTDVYKKSHPRQ